MLVKDYEPYALDDAMLSGGLSLYLASPRADYLKGHPVSINCKNLSSFTQVSANHTRGCRGNGGSQG